MKQKSLEDFFYSLQKLERRESVGVGRSSQVFIVLPRAIGLLTSGHRSHRSISVKKMFGLVSDKNDELLLFAVHMSCHVGENFKIL